MNVKRRGKEKKSVQIGRGAGYRVLKCIFTHLDRNHIPYLSGVIVEGPRGGLYFLDEFNFQMLFEYYNIYAKIKIDNPAILYKLFVKENPQLATFVNHSLDSDETKRRFAERKNMTPLIRKAGLDITFKMAKDLQLYRNDTTKM